MQATYINLYLEQGSTYNNTINLGDSYILSGVANSQIRTSYYTANVTAYLDVALDSTNNTVQLTAPSEVTSTISGSQNYVYDVIVNDSANNTTTRILEGVVYVSPSVTR